MPSPIQFSPVVAILRWGMAILVIKITFNIVSNFGDYFPPNFRSDFLLGREGHFFGFYRAAFYSHIISSPLAIFAGLLLMNGSLRNRFPKIHRNIGKWNVVNILLLVVPSGLCMSQYAITGTVAGLAFATLALLTAACAIIGWNHASNRRFGLHEQWMTRCFLLLSSAIFLRLIAGIATVVRLDAAWLYPATAWASWVIPLTVFETIRFVHGRQE